MTPPLLELFRKFIRFGDAILPLVHLRWDRSSEACGSSRSWVFIQTFFWHFFQIFSLFFFFFLGGVTFWGLWSLEFWWQILKWVCWHFRKMPKFWERLYLNIPLRPTPLLNNCDDNFYFTISALKAHKIRVTKSCIPVIYKDGEEEGEILESFLNDA